jgi:hypothetical protein
MNMQELLEAVMGLPKEARLDLARRIIASTSAEPDASNRVAEAVAGIEDIVTGKVAGLSEAEFGEALRR